MVKNSKNANLFPHTIVGHAVNSRVRVVHFDLLDRHHSTCIEQSLVDFAVSSRVDQPPSFPLEVELIFSIKVL